MKMLHLIWQQSKIQEDRKHAMNREYSWHKAQVPHLTQHYRNKGITEQKVPWQCRGRKWRMWRLQRDDKIYNILYANLTLCFQHYCLSIKPFHIKNITDWQQLLLYLRVQILQLIVSGLSRWLMAWRWLSSTIGFESRGNVWPLDSNCLIFYRIPCFWPTLPRRRPFRYLFWCPPSLTAGGKLWLMACMYYIVFIWS